MFEIRVAVIGYVSVGKTTVINALFGDEFGEVSMKRTTAVVNSFHICFPKEDKDASSAHTSNDGDQENSEYDDDDGDSNEVVSNKVSASVILEQTAADNASFRNSNIVKERAFDICLKEPFHNSKMRPDTKLVIVDIPGINEAGTSSKYKDYVNDQWHTFDIVVLVMDARQGVNTEEQHDLLKLAKDNMTNCKHIPLIVLSNKVDDPENEEQKALLGEARKAVEKLFDVDDREKALETLLFDGPRSVSPPPAKRLKTGHIEPELFPAVVPISAMHAFVYRCGSRLAYKDFCAMDVGFIDKIGKDSYGRQWRRFNKTKQLEKAFKAVTEEDQCQDGLTASNFDTFAKVLSICIGNEEQQTRLIGLQIDVALARMKEVKAGVDLGAELLVAQSKLTALQKSTDHLPATFWKSYDRLKKKAFAAFKESFSPAPFGAPISQLYNYMKALKTLEWPGEKDEAMKAAKELVLQYAVKVLESDTMKAKSGSDQSLILGSMLLSSSETFNLHFGLLKLHLETAMDMVAKQHGKVKDGHCPSCQRVTSPNKYGTDTHYCSPCGRTYIDVNKTLYCPRCPLFGYRTNIRLPHSQDAASIKCTAHCLTTFWILPTRNYHKMKVVDGKLVPANAKEYKKNITIVVPESLDDPEHFGHILWKCCQLLKED